MALRRLTAKYKTYNIWAFDTETDEEGQFKLGVIYNPIKDDYEIYYTPYEMAKALLRPIGREYQGRHYMAAFNTPYDLNTLHPYFILNRLENKGRFITCIANRNTDRYKHKYRYFTFMDLSNFVRQGTTLKELSDNLGVHYIDIHNYKDPLILDACKSHAKATSEILQKFQDVVNKDFQSNLKLTVASTAMDVFQRKFLGKGHGIGKECKPDIIPDHKFHQGLSYRGGITELFNKNYFENVTCIDIKSMYPYVMKDLVIPNMNKCSNILHKSNVEDYLKNFEGCAELVIKIPKNLYFHPFLIKRAGGKLMSMWGNVYGVFTFSEIRYMLKLGIEIKECNWLLQFKRRENFFTNFVNFLYKYKSKDKTGVYKILMNSLYGKFGQKHKYETGYKVIEEGGVYNIEECYELNGIIYNYISEDKNIREYHRKAYPLIASYVTAAARMYLYEEMRKVGLDKIIYCDTDSLVINDTLDNIKKKVDIKDELGKWEVKFIGEFEARGLKYYRYREPNNDWTYVIKGVPEKYKKEFWQNNRVTVKRPTKFNTAVRSKGEKKLNKWVTFTLESKNPPLKRKFLKNGSSEMIKYK